jgi:hypothetical protein
LESWFYFQKFKSSGYDNDDVNNFIPANLKLGTGFDFILDDFNKVA